MALHNQTINLFNFEYPVLKLNKDNVKVGTFFSGIGSPEMAFKRLKDNGVIKNFESVFYCEIDKYAVKSYCAIHNNFYKMEIFDLDTFRIEKELFTPEEIPKTIPTRKANPTRRKKNNGVDT